LVKDGADGTGRRAARRRDDRLGVTRSSPSRQAAHLVVNTIDGIGRPVALGRTLKWVSDVCVCVCVCVSGGGGGG